MTSKRFHEVILAALLGCATMLTPALRKRFPHRVPIKASSSRITQTQPAPLRSAGDNMVTVEKATMSASTPDTSQLK